MFLVGASGALYKHILGRNIINQPVIRGYNQIQEQINDVDRRLSLGENNVLDNVRSELVSNRQRYFLENSAEILEANA